MAELRRDAPGAAAQSYIERLEKELEMEKDVNRQQASEGNEMDVDLLDVGAQGRTEDVERMWERGTQGLVDLARFPEVLAKVERAQKAAEVVGKA